MACLNDVASRPTSSPAGGRPIVTPGCRSRAVTPSRLTASTQVVGGGVSAARTSSTAVGVAWRLAAKRLASVRMCDSLTVNQPRPLNSWAISAGMVSPMRAVASLRIDGVAY